jgi:hypothetical protein
VRDGSPIAIVLDRNGDLRRRVGVEEGSWALLIADRWGVLYDVVQTEDVDDLPDLDDIDAWLKFLATQCPECGVIDEPTSPEWGVP